MKKILLTTVFLIHLFLFAQDINSLPKGFVYMTDYIPNIAIDLKYHGPHNFVGKPIDGYTSSKLILTERATRAIQKIEKELNQEGLG